MDGVREPSDAEVTDSAFNDSGTFVGPYRLIERIGEGGMGIVHLATGPDGERVAVKVLRPHLASDAVGRERLAREVRSMRRVRGPHVAEVLAADVDAELPYVVTRYVPGRPLDEIVREYGPPGPGQMLRLAHGLADALACIHLAGVVHRDLKPGNVLLAGGVPTVIDFGIAQVADDAALTSTGLFIGTPGYFAPEIARGERATPASDIASWGATVTYAATGRPPYGRGPVEVVLARVAGSQYDLTGVPAELVPLVMSALADNPVRRPSAAEVRARLAELLTRGGLSAVPRPVTTPVPAAAQPIRPGTRLLTQVPAPAPPGRQGRLNERPPAAVGNLAAAGPAPMRTGYAGHAPAYPPFTPPQPAPWVAPGGAPPVLQPEPVRRGGLLSLGLLAVLAGVAAIAPVLGAAVLGSVLVVLSVGDRSAGLVDRRRAAYGRRGTDWLAAVGALPWQLATAAIAAALATALAAAVAIAAAASALLLSGRSNLETGVLAAAVALAVIAWWGPGGRRHRSGAGRVAYRLGPAGRTLVVAVLVGAAIVAFAVAVATPAVWWPTTAPSISNLLPALPQLPALGG